MSAEQVAALEKQRRAENRKARARLRAVGEQMKVVVDQQVEAAAPSTVVRTPSVPPVGPPATMRRRPAGALRTGPAVGPPPEQASSRQVATLRIDGTTGNAGGRRTGTGQPWPELRPETSAEWAWVAALHACVRLDTLLAKRLLDMPEVRALRAPPPVVRTPLPGKRAKLPALMDAFRQAVGAASDALVAAGTSTACRPEFVEAASQPTRAFVAALERRDARLRRHRTAAPKTR